MRDAIGWVAAIVAAVFVATDGPTWLELTLVTAAVVFAFSWVTLDYVPANVGPGDVITETRAGNVLIFAWMASIAVGLVVLIALLLHPSSGLKPRRSWRWRSSSRRCRR